MIDHDQGAWCLNATDLLLLQGFRSLTKYSFCLPYQPQSGYFFCINIVGGYQIDPRGLDTAVAQHVCESRNVTGGTVETSGKEMTQIMREHLFPCDASDPTKSLHLRPDLPAIKPPAASRQEKLP